MCSTCYVPVLNVDFYPCSAVQVFGDSDDEDLPDTHVLEKPSRPQQQQRVSLIPKPLQEILGSERSAVTGLLL